MPRTGGHFNATPISQRRGWVPISGTTISPDQIANLLAWYKADVGVYSDTGFTTPAIVGGNVGSVRDQSGNNNDLVALDTAHPSLVSGPYINFSDSPATRLGMGGNASAGIGTGDLYIAGMADVHSTTTLGVLLGMGYINSELYISPIAKSLIVVGADSAGNDASGSINTWYIFEGWRSGGIINASRNGADGSNAVSHPGSVSNAPIHLGGSQYDSIYVLNGGIKEAFMYTRMPTSLQRVGLRAYLHARWP